MTAAQTRTFPILSHPNCNIPASAQAYSLNFTVVPAGGLSYLSAWPTGNPPSPPVSILNDFLGTVLANAAVVPAGTNGSIDVFVTDMTHVVIDINGYYAPQISLANGTAAAPALTFAGDNTSGLYSSGAGTVSVATAGANRLTVAANGNVGIGTTAPGSKLDVAGDISMSGNLLWKGGPVLKVSGPASGGNVSLGPMAMPNNSPNGINNTALGTNTLFSNTTGGANTATGCGALQQNISGYSNTATGRSALSNNTTGYANAATGDSALGSNTTGYQNTATGETALGLNTVGTYNTADGWGALYNNSTGSLNTALGSGALINNITGNNNIAIGNSAAFNVSAGNSNNIHIGSQGAAADSATIRIGSSVPSFGALPQTSFFAAAIRGVTTTNNDAIPVMIDSAGQLGTVSSSRRFKEDIQDMGEASSGLLHLRPVTFRYKKPFADGTKPLQYGLIAEEVAEVYPDLVARSADGQIETVKYQVMDSMLLNEVQRQQAEIGTQKEQIHGLEQQNQDLQRRLARLEAALVSAPGEPKIP